MLPSSLTEWKDESQAKRVDLGISPGKERLCRRVHGWRLPHRPSAVKSLVGMEMGGPGVVPLTTRDRNLRGNLFQLWSSHPVASGILGIARELSLLAPGGVPACSGPRSGYGGWHPAYNMRVRGGRTGGGRTAVDHRQCIVLERLSIVAVVNSGPYRNGVENQTRAGSGPSDALYAVFPRPRRVAAVKSGVCTAVLRSGQIGQVV